METEQVFICYRVSPAQAKLESNTAVLTPQKDGSVEVLRKPVEGENYSVKNIIRLDGGRVVRYLFKKPAKPKKLPTKEELKAHAIRKTTRVSE